MERKLRQILDLGYRERLRLADELFCDERSLRRIAKGQTVRGVTGERLVRLLRERGFMVPEPAPKAPSKVLS